LDPYLPKKDHHPKSGASSSASGSKNRTTKEPHEAKATDNTALNLSYLEEISGHNADFIQSMLERFFSEIPSLMETINHASQQGLSADVRVKSHQLKSIAGYLRETELRADLQFIEDKAAQDALDEDFFARLHTVQEKTVQLLLLLRNHINGQ
ncbi:Hpt domain-containing protein, partial [Arthrospira platensis SPKY1]|nr:Hpt domain-containing protein [Arthrospira platensis SPKY1]